MPRLSTDRQHDDFCVIKVKFSLTFMNLSAWCQVISLTSSFIMKHDGRGDELLFIFRFIDLYIFHSFSSFY